MVTSTSMSCPVLPNRRTKLRLEWRIASETARFAALVASLPWTSTPIPISVIQRMRGIKTPEFVARRNGALSLHSFYRWNALQAQRRPVRVDSDLPDRIETMPRRERMDDVATEIRSQAGRQFRIGNPEDRGLRHSLEQVGEPCLETCAIRREQQRDIGFTDVGADPAGADR